MAGYRVRYTLAAQQNQLRHGDAPDLHRHRRRHRTRRNLQLIARWLAADPATLVPSLLAYIGHPAYGLDPLCADLDRFTFLLGGNDGEFLLGEDPP